MEGLSLGEILETGEIVLNIVGCGYDENDDLIFTWSEVDTLKKV